MFLREFERAFRDHNVSIQDHWLSNLEICFESCDNNLHYDWFCRYVKKPVVELNRKVTWDDAKALLQEKFDLASQTTPQTWMKLLLNFKQRPDQSLVPNCIKTLFTLFIPRNEMRQLFKLSMLSRNIKNCITGTHISTGSRF
ncbi:hypothetical protein G6F61_013671 [Rhizopus arrhizus]|nr:hypothetical protein G6F61_013671 [Rhizopus arrhizus]